MLLMEASGDRYALGVIRMLLNPFDSSLDSISFFLEANRGKLLALSVILTFFFYLWYSSNKNRNVRKMRATFERTGLFVKIDRGKRTVKLFPALIRFSEKIDDEYYVFEYELRPGMALHQFEDKKKFFEAAFNAKAIVNGKGGRLEIKIHKTPYTGISSSQRTI